MAVLGATSYFLESVYTGSTSHDTKFLADGVERVLKSTTFSPKNTRKRQDHERQRILRGSKCIGCPMRLKIRAVDRARSGREWKIVYTRDESHHQNHVTAEDIHGFAAHRTRAAIQIDPWVFSSLEGFVSAQHAAGVSVASIHAFILHGNPLALTNPKGNSNAISAARLHDLATQTSMQALISELTSREFFFFLVYYEEEHASIAEFGLGPS